MLSFLKRDKFIFILLFVYYLFIVFITPLRSQFDLTGFLLPWMKSFVSTGIQNAYQNPLINYPPITLYVMYAYAMAVSLMKLRVDSVIYYFKDVVFLFDLATFYFLIRIMQRFKVQLLMIVFFICNIAIIYNSIFWGQVDSIYTFFVVFSVYFVLTGRPLLSLAGLLFALASKPQAALFIPVILLLLSPYFKKEKALLLKASLLSFLVLIGIFLPFLLHGTIDDYFKILHKTTDYYPFVSMFAFNFWLLVFGIDRISHVQDSIELLGFSYRVWGLAMFFVWALTFLYPVWRIVRSQLKHFRGLEQREWQIVFLSLTLIALAFFFFNTQMHERYAHAAIVFAGVYAIVSGKYKLYAAVSFAYLVNLTYIYNSLAFNPGHILPPFVIALLYGGVIIYGTIELYRLSSQWKKELHHTNAHDLTNQHK